MPEVDGAKLTASLRSSDASSRTPIIVLTAAGGPKEWQRLSAIGADAFLVKPVNAVYAFRRAKELEAAGHRVQHWECEGSSNDVLANGTTTSKLPGEAGFKDVRGSTLFPDLPGQSRDPIYNTTLPTGKE